MKCVRNKVGRRKIRYGKDRERENRVRADYEIKLQC